jgi:two-component system nitrogen regulation sensor histidine kinase NtrY
VKGESDRRAGGAPDRGPLAGERASAGRGGEMSALAARPRAKSANKPVPHDLRVLQLALLAGLPGAAATLILITSHEVSTKLAWTIGSLVLCVWLGAAFALRERVTRVLQTASNLVAALREGDFSVRGRGAGVGDAHGELMLELNSLGDTLREQRLGSLEAGALLRAVMDGISVAVLAFDAEGRPSIANRAAEQLLGAQLSQLSRKSAAQLGLPGLLEGQTPRTVELSLPGGSGPYEVRRGTVRLSGLPHQLVVLADLRRALREEERLAWQRLVRVLGHEINNSLAPIRSISESLRELVLADPRPSGWEEDVSSGLAVIERRAESLGRFMTSYARLARLPPPTPGPVEVAAWVGRVAALEKRLQVTVAPGPPLTIEADADQLDQLLINLLRNAADAALETGGGVRVSWSLDKAGLEVSVDDEGPGLSNTSNLFVPFFTTKPGGSGIGLALSRQIAEQHHGTLMLENRTDRTGCRARLQLPRR